MLKEENVQVKTQLAEKQIEATTLIQEKEDLSKKISTAAVHKAYNVIARPVYFKRKGEEVITEKASRVKQIKTSFILSENSLIPAGPVNVYCRIAIPETGRVLTPEPVMLLLSIIRIKNYNILLKKRSIIPDKQKL